MINIISRSLSFNKRIGPQVVALNLIKSLDELGYPYCINKSLDATSQLWIHDDGLALREAAKLKLKAIVGPNIYEFPRHIPSGIDMSNFVCIQPSNSAIDFWKYLGFNSCPIDAWPVGIDTDLFIERSKPEKGVVLVFFKGRVVDTEKLFEIEKVLKKINIDYEIFLFGSYTVDEYIKKVKSVKYIIWVGGYETQGLAFQEALSMNLPLLVWDISKFSDYRSKFEKKRYTQKELNYVGVTSVCYFDERCGVVIKTKEEITSAINEMEASWHKFNPRAYILENLSLKKQGKDLIELFNKHYGISYESGQNEFLQINSHWMDDLSIYDKISTSVKKKIVKNGVLHSFYQIFRSLTKR